MLQIVVDFSLEANKLISLHKFTSIKIEVTLLNTDA